MDLMQVGFDEWVRLFAEGLRNTLWVFVGGVVIATVLGLLLGWAHSSRFRAVRAVAIVVIELSRGTSVIIQVFWIYYALPLVLGVHIPAYVAGWIAIGLTEGAYIAEVVRGGIQAVPRGQFESSTALNFSPFHRFRRIVLPQAVPIMLPSYANHVVSALKETSVVSLITLHDLTAMANLIRGRSGETVLPYLVLAVLYLALAMLIQLALKWAERKAWIGPPLPRSRFSIARLRSA